MDRNGRMYRGQNFTAGPRLGWFSHGSGRAQGMEDPPSGVEQPERIVSKATQNMTPSINRMWCIMLISYQIIKAGVYALLFLSSLSLSSRFSFFYSS